MTSIRGQIALVTGASAGIGRAAALLLAEHGVRVFAAARRLDKLEALAAEAHTKGWLIEAVQLDVTDADSIERAMQHIRQATDGYELDILVNNAGYGQMGPLEEVPLAALRQQFETNVFGVVALIQRVVPPMRQRRYGRIINISSLGGRLALPYGGAYTASKFALEAISDALRIELAPWNIRVIVVEPGLIATEFGNVATSNLPHSSDSAYAHATTFMSMFEHGAGFGAAPTVVGNAVVRAARNRRPAARVVVPAFYGPLLRLAELLPVAVLDAATKLAIRAIEKVVPYLDQTAKPDHPTLDQESNG